MADETEQQNAEELAWNLASAELAYSVLARYVEHAQISGVIIALLASKLGEEGLKPLAQSEHWESYLASKRLLAEVKTDIERLTLLIERARAQQPKE